VPSLFPELEGADALLRPAPSTAATRFRLILSLHLLSCTQCCFSLSTCCPYLSPNPSCVGRGGGNPVEPEHLPVSATCRRNGTSSSELVVASAVSCAPHSAPCSCAGLAPTSSAVVELCIFLTQPLSPGTLFSEYQLVFHICNVLSPSPLILSCAGVLCRTPPPSLLFPGTVLVCSFSLCYNQRKLILTSSVLCLMAVFFLLRQVAPTSSAVVELYIFLAQPCLATHLLLHSAHGADDYTTPCAFDLASWDPPWTHCTPAWR